jgi:heme exporter protein D
MEVLIPITLFVCAAAVLIVRPVTKRLGALIEVLVRERQARLDAAARAGSTVSEIEARATARLLERISHRLDLIEERLDFVERLSDTRERDGHRLTSASG